MAKGDHIYKSLWIDGNPITHHGIDCGDGYVIEFQGYHQGGKVIKKPLSEFKKGKTVYVKEYGQCDSPDKVVSRAIDLLRQEGYCLFTNNCEHLASYCKTGRRKSEQIKNISAIAKGTVTQGVVAKIVVEVAGKSAIKSLNPISKTLVKVGLKQAPKVAGKVGAGIAGAGGIVTGLATYYVIEKVLEDDKDLPQHERDARKTGRVSGQVGTAVCAIGGTAIGAVVGGTGAIVAGALAAPVVVGGAAAYLGYKIFKKK